MIEHVDHEALAAMSSGDFDEPMTDTLANLRDTYARAERAQAERGGDLYGYEVHPADVEHGGVDRYLAVLRRDIAVHGIREPLIVRGGNVVVEGHHRAVAAMQLRLTHIPIHHIQGSAS